MLNSQPNNKNYHQGNYIPINKDKVLKLNNQGGIFFRSNWEKKIIVWLDNNINVTKWGAECIKVPYQLKHIEKTGDIDVKSHIYYPDFYYEIKNLDGSVKKVIAEVKPKSEYDDVIMFEKKMFDVPKDASLKKMRSVEYRFKMAQKNSEKWKNMIKYCDKNGYQFIIITEETLKRFGL